MSDEKLMYLFFFFTLIVPLLWASSNISKPSCLYFNLTLTTVGQKAVNCQNFKFAIDDDVIDNQILEGHVFQNLTVPNAIQCHLKCKDDCLCVSMNYFPRSKENNCELNVANKDRSQRRWNGGKEEIIMIWWEATRWRWDKIVCLIICSFIYELS